MRSLQTIDRGSPVPTTTAIRPFSAIYPSLRDKRVIVTGGATGIGACLVERFADQGAHVGFVDIQADAAQRLVELLGHAPHAPLFRLQDIADSAGLIACLHALIAELGGCDVLISNAASDQRHRVEAVTPDYWDERIAINLKHMFFAAQAVAPAMTAAGGGVVLNLGSISWHLGLEDLSVYQTAKAGAEGLTRSLARELGPTGIRVNTIIPGNVQTPRQMQLYTPGAESEIVAAQCIKHRLQPFDIAAMALFLASDDARCCTAHSYWVDGGWG